MKCTDGCEFFKNNTCIKAETSLSSIEDPICLQRITIILLRDIAYNLAVDNDDLEDGEDWKFEQS